MEDYRKIKDETTKTLNERREIKKRLDDLINSDDFKKELKENKKEITEILVDITNNKDIKGRNF